MRLDAAVVEVAVEVVGIVARSNPLRQRPAMFRPLQFRRLQQMLRHPPTRQDKLGRPHLPHKRRTNRWAPAVAGALSEFGSSDCRLERQPDLGLQ